MANPEPPRQHFHQGCMHGAVGCEGLLAEDIERRTAKFVTQTVSGDAAFVLATSAAAVEADCLR